MQPGGNARAGRNVGARHRHQRRAQLRCRRLQRAWNVAGEADIDVPAGRSAACGECGSDAFDFQLQTNGTRMLPASIFK